ncbi:MAG: hypothetical protein LCH98_03925 [Actinobacteria bacterium]|nr:hypothetical protein [Actinomycetota bacterium]
MTTAALSSRAWHPLTGAWAVAVPALVAVAAAALWRGAGAGPAWGGIALTTYLAMGTVAGFSVSGST